MRFWRPGNGNDCWAALHQSDSLLPPHPPAALPPGHPTSRNDPSTHHPWLKSPTKESRLTPLPASSPVPVSCRSLVPAFSITVPLPVYSLLLPWAEACVQAPLFTGKNPGEAPCWLPLSPHLRMLLGGALWRAGPTCPLASNPPRFPAVFTFSSDRDTVQSLPAAPRKWPGSPWPPSHGTVKVPISSMPWSGLTFATTLLSFLIAQLILFNPWLSLSSSGWVAHICKSSSYLSLVV